MKTLNAICLNDCRFFDGSKEISLNRGQEYIISEPNEKNQVTVFSHYWVSGVPFTLFGGVEPGPGSDGFKAVKSEGKYYSEKIS